MAKTDARITVNLPQEVYLPLKATTDALGVSMSSMLRDLAEAAVPMLEVLQGAAEVLQTAPERHRAAVQAFADDLDRLKPSAESLMAQVLDLGPRAADPRASNTGVTQ